MSWKRTVILCLAILLGSALMVLFIFSTEPSAQKTGATQKTAMLVETVEVQKGSYHPRIEGMGTVIPVRDIMLSPRISGQILEVTSKMTPGNYVEKGDTLLKIDPTDYQNALQQRKSQLTQAKSDLVIEMGRQQAARKEYEAYGDTLPAQNKALVLRNPQLQSARAQVQSAEAALLQAKENLARTVITAPFNAQVLSRNVNIGSQVAPGNTLGRLVGTDHFWVEATVPVSKLKWIPIPENSSSDTVVTIKNRSAWSPIQKRKGVIDKVLGSLEGQTRMARILVTVPDPHTYQNESSSRPKLMLGSYVQTIIKGKQLPNIFRIDRDYIRNDETVWVMKNGKLDIRSVSILLQDAKYAYISNGLENNEQLVTTNLSNPTQSAPLRLQ
ncbi:efflux RND transporter periplasmic adaptor subunit [Fodinibius saliphilus]|uniref:efflux RND transporter periplasmic adaptor subunit n=1 Tax=Fodinibius saliphilus TaxID=1920650 RepID=UPI001109B577|nr:efflux RND transporter periplasmic adaptor subunit [Fodinibius saliphilus]